MDLLQETTLKNNLLIGNTLVPYAKVDGEWYIAVKPMCIVLGVDYERQRARLRNHHFLRPNVREVQLVVYGAKTVGAKHGEGRRSGNLDDQDPEMGPAYRFQGVQVGADQGLTTTGSDLHPEAEMSAQRRMMLTLPIGLFLGWVMELPVSKPEPMALKWNLFAELMNYFEKGRLDMRSYAKVISDTNARKEAVLQRLMDNPDYQAYLQAAADNDKAKKQLNQVLAATKQQLLLEFGTDDQPAGHLAQ